MEKIPENRKFFPVGKTLNSIFTTEKYASIAQWQSGCLVSSRPGVRMMSRKILRYEIPSRGLIAEFNSAIWPTFLSVKEFILPR